VYAVIRTGGKQYKVQVGDVIDVEHVAGDDGGNVELVPLLVVDDEGKVSARPSELAGAKVTASVVGHHRGEKLRVFTYKNKSGQRHHQGHRQSLTRLKVEGIDPPGKATARARTARPAKDKDAEAKAKPAEATAGEAAAEESSAKAESGTKAAAGAKGETAAKAKDATTTKAKTTRASATKDSGAKDSGAKGSGAKDAAAKPASRSGRTRAKQDEEN
jgi:large subunit ribosomal protein L21